MPPYQSGCYIDVVSKKSVINMPKALMVVTALHAVLTILLAILGHKGAEKRKCNAYPQLNASTIVQRATGIGMLLLLGLHIAGAATHFQPKILHSIMHPVFFAVSFLHIAVSVSKAIITLGIGNAFWEKQGFILREDINYRNTTLRELVRIDT